MFVHPHISSRPKLRAGRSAQPRVMSKQCPSSFLAFMSKSFAQGGTSFIVIFPNPKKENQITLLGTLVKSTLPALHSPPECANSRKLPQHHLFAVHNNIWYTKVQYIACCTFCCVQKQHRLCGMSRKFGNLGSPTGGHKQREPWQMTSDWDAWIIQWIQMGYKWDTSGQRKFRSLISSKFHVTNLEKRGWR